MGELATFAAGDVTLQCGVTLPDAQLVYETHGTLDAARDNAVVLPTRFGGTHEHNAYLIGPGRALDPARWFVVVPNMLGNGVSSSPSNVGGALAGRGFPLVTIRDNVQLQHRLLVEQLGVERIALAIGWSMGGQQAYEWAAAFPRLVERCAVLCGAARTTPHTHVFLEGMKAALTADPAIDAPDGRPPLRGLRAIGRAWAGWALSQAFYREGLYREQGYATLEDYLLRYWEGMFLERDAHDVLSMIATWQHADVSANARHRGDFAAAMGSIEARTLVMPGRTDLYFPPEDSEAEVALLRDGRLLPIESAWGHYAGGGRSPADLSFVERALASLLEED
jgi:homoserine O-acetyltransferase